MGTAAMDKVVRNSEPDMGMLPHISLRIVTLYLWRESDENRGHINDYDDYAINSLK